MLRERLRAVLRGHVRQPRRLQRKDHRQKPDQHCEAPLHRGAISARRRRGRHPRRHERSESARAPRRRGERRRRREERAREVEPGPAAGRRGEERAQDRRGGLLLARRRRSKQEERGPRGARANETPLGPRAAVRVMHVPAAAAAACAVSARRAARQRRRADRSTAAFASRPVCWRGGARTERSGSSGW